MTGTHIIKRIFYGVWEGAIKKAKSPVLVLFFAVWAVQGVHGGLMAGSGMLIETGVVERGGIIAQSALKKTGIPYVFGGMSPDTGFDCSGLTWYSHRKAGIKIPRSVEAQFENGEKVEFFDLRRGDIVFFEVYGKGVKGLWGLRDFIAVYIKIKPTHAAVYLGNGKFIHAPKSGDTVREDTLHNNYWKKRYSGARRYGQ